MSINAAEGHRLEEIRITIFKMAVLGKKVCEWKLLPTCWDTVGMRGL